MMRYFKKYWNETTGDLLNDHWGTSTYYFETDAAMNVLRQIQIFETGNMLKYSDENMDDEFGGLADQPLPEEEFINAVITEEEFNAMWETDNLNL